MGFLRELFNTLTGASTIVYLVLGAAALISIGALVWHHDHALVAAEDNKIEAASAQTILKVEDEKQKIRNIPITDARTINRLRAGTYFNH